MPQQVDCVERYYRWGPPITKKSYSCTPSSRFGTSKVTELLDDDAYAFKRRDVSEVIERWKVKRKRTTTAEEDPLREEFACLAEKWLHDTRHLSVITRKIVHPAYLQIIGMGQTVIPYVLEALRDKPAHWFVALRALAKTDPSPEGSNPSAARDAWLSWGERNGFIRR